MRKLVPQAENFAGDAIFQVDNWKKTYSPINLTDYVNGFRRRLYEVGKLAKTLKL